jgi:hypothetical protein
LDLTAGSDRVRAVREGKTWRLVEPLEDLADATHADSLINDLNALRVEDFLADDVDLAELGLDRPDASISLVMSGRDNPVMLEFGKTRELDGATHVACRRNGGSLFWVTDAAATRLAKAPVTWRASKVWDFETWDAEQLSISTGESSVELARSEGLWVSADGSEVDHGKVQDRLTKLAALEAVEFDLVQPGTDAMGTVDLAVSGEGDEPPSTVSYSFYAPMAKGGDAMVTVSGRATVMSVDAEAVAEILTEPGALLETPQIDGDGSQALN